MPAAVNNGMINKMPTPEVNDCATIRNSRRADLSGSAKKNPAKKM
jgi:hypothetical protein